LRPPGRARAFLFFHFFREENDKGGDCCDVEADGDDGYAQTKDNMKTMKGMMRTMNVVLMNSGVLCDTVLNVKPVQYDAAIAVVIDSAAEGNGGDGVVAAANSTARHRYRGRCSHLHPSNTWTNR